MTEPTKGLNVNLLIKPLTTVVVGVDTLYLYSVRAGDLELYEAIAATIDPTSKFRMILPRLASLTPQRSWREKREPLPAEWVAALSNAELETVAQAYVATAAFQRLLTEPRENGEALQRQPSEPAVDYLCRLLDAEVANAGKLFKHMHQTILGATQKLFEPVRASALALGETVKRFETLPALSPAPFETVDASVSDAFRDMQEENARRAEMRREALEMAKLTGQMTAESAKLLQDLALKSTEFLQRFDERNQQSDKEAKRNLTIAVWSVLTSAVFAAFALLVAMASYRQDAELNRNDEAWQQEMVTIQRAELSARNRLEQELDRLREEVRQLRAQRSDAALATSVLPAVNVNAPTPKN